MIRYESQKVARYYLGLALILFCLQVAMGLWLAINYAFTLPQGLVDVFSFATARAIHTNTLVAWMLLGFMGGSYFILP
jgi:nitric oxide reductase subunit B